MIAELAAAALGGFLAAGTGWVLDRQREATKLERSRSLLTRAILDDLSYSQQIYDKVGEEWEKTKIAWFSTLNELKQSRQPYMNSKDWVVILDDEDLRRDIFRYYLQSTDKITILENSQSRKYALERTCSDSLRQIQVNDPAITPDAAKDKATQATANENQEYNGIVNEMPNQVRRLVDLKATALSLANRLQPTLPKTRSRRR